MSPTLSLFVLIVLFAWSSVFRMCPLESHCFSVPYTILQEQVTQSCPHSAGRDKAPEHRRIGVYSMWESSVQDLSDPMTYLYFYKNQAFTLYVEFNLLLCYVINFIAPLLSQPQTCLCLHSLTVSPTPSMSRRSHLCLSVPLCLLSTAPPDLPNPGPLSS